MAHATRPAPGQITASRRRTHAVQVAASEAEGHVDGARLVAVLQVHVQDAVTKGLNENEAAQVGREAVEEGAVGDCL